MKSVLDLMLEEGQCCICSSCARIRTNSRGKAQGPAKWYTAQLEWALGRSISVDWICHTCDGLLKAASHLQTELSVTLMELRTRCTSQRPSDGEVSCPGGPCEQKETMTAATEGQQQMVGACSASTPSSPACAPTDAVAAPDDTVAVPAGAVAVPAGGVAPLSVAAGPTFGAQTALAITKRPRAGPAPGRAGRDGRRKPARHPPRDSGRQPERVLRPSGAAPGGPPGPGSGPGGPPAGSGSGLGLPVPAERGVSPAAAGASAEARGGAAGRAVRPDSGGLCRVAADSGSDPVGGERSCVMAGPTPEERRCVSPARAPQERPSLAITVLPAQTARRCSPERNLGQDGSRLSPEPAGGLKRSRPGRASTRRPRKAPYEQLGDKWRCNFCSLLFESRTGAHGHAQVHADPERCVCPGCGRRYSSVYSYRRHRAACVDGRRPACRVCGKTFADAAYLMQHELQHAGGTPLCHQCDRCGLVFAVAAQLRRHAAAVHCRDAPHRCDICRRAFKLEVQLRRHRRSVHAVRPAATCDVCGRGFKRADHLRAHMAVHTGQRPHVCAECGRGFTRADTLADHARLHTGERPYSCPECGVCFREHRAYGQHLKTKHGLSRRDVEKNGGPESDAAG